MLHMCFTVSECWQTNYTTTRSPPPARTGPAEARGVQVKYIKAKHIVRIVFVDRMRGWTAFIFALQTHSMNIYIYRKLMHTPICATAHSESYNTHCALDN